ncbi:MAG TPA: nitroreductase/quinone reductase family protein [Chloroflexota bacterium]|nr:nitroreductase/quinone reductase family protein [Chloroflexota bacterium]
MAEKLEWSGWFKAANRMMGGLVKMGFTPNHTVLLIVPGRKSGVLRSTPVSLLELDGQRYVNAPYGVVDWVRNVRLTKTVQLRVGRRMEQAVFEELSARDAAPVLRQALRVAPKLVRQRFGGLTADSPLEDIEREAPKHPVFRVSSVQAVTQS